MTCRATRSLLPLFVGGDLDVRQRRAVVDHLAVCAGCAAEIEQYRATRELLSSATLSFSASERALVRQRVREEIARRSERPWPFSGLPRLPWPALAALAGVVIVAASLVAPFVARDVREKADAVAALPTRRPSPAPPAAEHVAETVPAPRRTRGVRGHASSVNAASPVRLEFQTGDANVRIIWFGGAPSVSRKNVS